MVATGMSESLKQFWRGLGELVRALYRQPPAS
jgi:hypothetical protein